MTELETLKRAKMYIDSLARGVDPISGQPAEDDSVINNVRISRCLFYVSDVLEKVINNGGNVAAKKTSVAYMPFCITDEQMQEIADFIADKKKQSSQSEHMSTFETDAFFAAALEASYGDKA